MSKVVPAEGPLLRVIGDGESPDGEVDALSTDDLLALYRNLVLLRMYDERSVVYHRQGRIGTYAIYWNHEDRKSTRLNSSHSAKSRMPSSA